MLETGSFCNSGTSMKELEVKKNLTVNPTVKSVCLSFYLQFYFICFASFSKRLRQRVVHKERRDCLPWHRSYCTCSQGDRQADTLHFSYSDLKPLNLLMFWTTQPTNTVALAKSTKATCPLSVLSMSAHKESMKDLHCGEKRCVRALRWVRMCLCVLSTYSTVTRCPAAPLSL